MKTIYGITELPSPQGVQAYAIDGDTGELIDQHFCSSESFAKSDLGFTDPLFTYHHGAPTSPHPTDTFNEKRHRRYAELYPDGYELVWVGYWQNDERIVPLRNDFDDMEEIA